MVIRTGRLGQWGALALLAGCASHPPPPEVATPNSLKPPADQLMTLQTHANGVQIYECRATREDPGRYTWALKAPEATLTDRSGRKIAKHYAGPTWEASDGSKVVGEVVARENSPQSDAIPWLLLTAKSTVGNGQFSGVRSIQRLHTVGGAAPPACAAPDAGHELRVKYAADYYFFVASRP
jgi:hypothetical protein